MTDTPEVICDAHLSHCRCGLAPHGPEIAHECVEPDPQCGGSWFDHPTDPTKMLVVRFPGLRGNRVTMEMMAEEFPGLVDPPPGEPFEEDRPPDRIGAQRGGISIIAPPSLEAVKAVDW